MQNYNFLLWIILAIASTIFNIGLVIKNYKEKNINECVFFSFVLAIQFMCWYQIIKLN
jgi:hypothetical protein